MPLPPIRWGHTLPACIVGLLGLVGCGALWAAAPVGEPSVAQLQAALDSGRRTSESIVRDYLGRIRRGNARLHAVILTNPEAPADARRSDARRRAGHLAGPLDGIPVLLKDNIDAAGLPTTAGSLALIDNVPARDAALVARLRESGMIVLGKTNLSEWANFRSSHSISGWSAVGGLTHNPYVLDRNACGSSAGSAVAVAAGFAPLAVGTETDGSITCPAAVSGVVGLKPTVGLVSRSGVIPISASQDTAGPMARDVAGTALLLTALAGSDPGDAATGAGDGHRTDYRRGLDPEALSGARIGVLRMVKDLSPATWRVFEAALRALRARGAILVEIAGIDTAPIGAAEETVLMDEFKTGVNRYLATASPGVQTRSLAALIAFDRAEPREMALFDQETFEQAEATSGTESPDYLAAATAAHDLAGPQGIDRMLADNHVVALVTPTTGPAWSTDWVNGDPSIGSASKLPAVAGYPHLTVPMGQVDGLPVGLSFIGPAWSEQQLLSLGYAFEAVAPRRSFPTGLTTLPPPDRADPR